jgi:hypothetical protein
MMVTLQTLKNGYVTYMSTSYMELYGFCFKRNIVRAIIVVFKKELISVSCQLWLEMEKIT